MSVDSSPSKEMRCTVFADEDPEIFKFLEALPLSRHRRRAMLLRLMRAGLSVVTEQYSAAIPTARAVPSIQDAPYPTAVVLQDMAGGFSAELYTERESIDPTDLFEVFGD